MPLPAAAPAAAGAARGASAIGRGVTGFGQKFLKGAKKGAPSSGKNVQVVDLDEKGEMKGLMVFTTPAALIFMPWAILLDAIGILLLCFGLDDFGVLDIVGSSTIGVWSYANSQIIQVTTKNPAASIKSAKLTKRLKWLRPLSLISEFVPYVGDIFPGWSVLTWTTLQEG